MSVCLSGTKLSNALNLRLDISLRSVSGLCKLSYLLHSTDGACNTLSCLPINLVFWLNQLPEAVTSALCRDAGDWIRIGGVDIISPEKWKKKDFFLEKSFWVLFIPEGHCFFCSIIHKKEKGSNRDKNWKWTLFEKKCYFILICFWFWFLYREHSFILNTHM